MLKLGDIKREYGMDEMDNLQSANGQGDQEEGEGKLCRDFMRNVCNRGNNCRFIHPNDIKIKTDPIFCHDYQQSKCFRSTCKFIHCSREEEEHYKATGELPDGYIPEDQLRAAHAAAAGRGMGIRGKGVRGAGGMGMVRGGRGGARGGGRGSWGDNEDQDTPLCKDYLKGVCDRPPGGCKFRHVDDPRTFRSGGAGGMLPRGGGVGAIARRRLGGAGYYEEGPEAKRSYDYGAGHLASEYEDYYTAEYTNPPPPPPPAPYAMATGRVEGYGTAMKAMEDENFMLKRRIEELKKQVSDLVATNEYLLSQNATLRLSTMNNADKQGNPTVNVTAASLASLVSMAQPMGLNPAAVSQSLATMSTLPSVSMSMAPVSMSQPLEGVVSMGQHQSTVYPMVTSQGVLPQGN